MSVLLLLLGCPEAPLDTGGLAVQPAPLDEVAVLSRMSLDLRGVRPSIDEIEAVEADPALLEDSLQDYLADPRFEERLVDLYAGVWKTRADGFVVGADGHPALFDSLDRLAFNRAVGEEPLRLIARVITEDAPWTEVVTADWTMASAPLAEVLPNLEATGDTGQPWWTARYTDLRPAAGILSTNGLWWRYTSTVHNYNRGRAAALVQGLLCDDRFDRPVEFVRDSITDIEDKVQEDPACVGCHVVLDPIGAYLFGFFRYHPNSHTEALWYYPEREDFWARAPGIEPSYYGQQTANGLGALGGALADDPRLLSCATQQVWTFLHGAEPGLEQIADLSAHRQVMVDDGLRLRAVFASVASSATYRSTDETVSGTVPPRRLAPQQLHASVADLTGYSWQVSGLEALENDTLGFRILAGGMDGMVVTRSATDHATSSVLVTERLAELASASAVDTEAALAPDERALFTEVADLDAAPTQAERTAQLQRLVLRTTGQRWLDDDPELVALASLYDGLLATTDDPAEAWRLTLSALLRHPDFVHY